MARPRSEDKQLALLEAATRVVAERGLGAPTSAIAKLAGVAEGTLFRYFATKDELLNALFLHINRGMCEYMTANYRAELPLAPRMESLWNSYIDWGLAHPQANKAFNQLSVSDVIRPALRAEADSLFPEMDAGKAFWNSQIFASLPDAFSEAVFVAVADATMAFAAREPAQAAAYKASGFAAISKIMTDS